MQTTALCCHDEAFINAPLVPQASAWQDISDEVMSERRAFSRL